MTYNEEQAGKEEGECDQCNCEITICIDEWTNKYTEQNIDDTSNQFPFPGDGQDDDEHECRNQVHHKIEKLLAKGTMIERIKSKDTDESDGQYAD